MDISELKHYDLNVLNMSPAQVWGILKSYGMAAVFDFNKLPDTGEGVMTKRVYLQRKAACMPCSIRKGDVCSKRMTRTHVSLKNTDGSPEWVPGCGCGLGAKQKDFDRHCPAGEW